MKKTKDEVQREAITALDANHGRGIIAMSTGTGKSRIPILIALREWHPDYKILICVPTEKLRDENWKAEFEKWGASSIWETSVERTCYVSMPKIKNQVYNMVIMDEAHNVTENNSQFFDQNDCYSLIALTATPPENGEKKQLLDDIGLKIIYRVTMDQAVEWGLVAPYKIFIVETELDKVTKNIAAGNKLKPFMQTEQQAYNYLCDQIGKLQRLDYPSPHDKKKLEMLIFRRMHFIYNLPSKLEATRFVIQKLIPREERTLIFAGSIEHAELLCANTYHSKTPKTSTSFDDFAQKRTNVLSCVNSLNEGHNIADLDRAVIEQLNSKSLKMIQRIGRIVRFREGHTAKIIIIVARATMDEEWCKQSLKDFNSANITVYNINDLKQKYR